MKIIHTADLHLDSKLSRYFDSAKASQRRNELLLSFQKMVEYGSTVGVSAIIIAGDLFDVRKISATARDAVYSSVINNPDIEFFYLRGNHDADTFLNQITEKYGSLPENLKMFSGDWTSYVHTEGDVSVVITGAEITKENNTALVDSLSLDRKRINIVTLHGQEVPTAGKTDAEVIPLPMYRDGGLIIWPSGIFTRRRLKSWTAGVPTLTAVASRAEALMRLERGDSIFLILQTTG